MVNLHAALKHREVKHNPVKQQVYLEMAALLLPIQMVGAWLAGMHVSTKSR